MTIREFELNYGGLLPANKSARILDLGCGKGELLEWLSEKGYDCLTGVDRIHYEGECSFQKINCDLFFYLQNSERKYDLIIMRHVIEHIPKNRLQELVNLLYLQLKDDGTLIIDTPNAGFILAASQRYADLEHEVMFTKETLEELLKPSFEVKIREAIPPGWRAITTRVIFGEYLRWFLWLLGIGNTWVYSPGIMAVCKKKEKVTK